MKTFKWKIIGKIGIALEKSMFSQLSKHHFFVYSKFYCQLTVFQRSEIEMNTKNYQDNKLFIFILHFFIFSGWLSSVNGMHDFWEIRRLMPKFYDSNLSDRNRMTAYVFHGFPCTLTRIHRIFSQTVFLECIPPSAIINKIWHLSTK